MLDLGLPDLDGADVLALIRATSDLPVIIATARDDEREIVRLLDAGADDYLIKPFSAARRWPGSAPCCAVRRPRPPSDPRCGRGRPRRGPGLAHRSLEGRELTLNRKEFDLLLALASRPGEVVSKRQLLAEVWQMPWGGADRTVDVHLSWLRRKLGRPPPSRATCTASAGSG